jgi:flagellin
VLAATSRDQVVASLTFINSELARLGASAKRVDNHSIFVSKLQDAITGGIGNLVDADLAGESARLQSLQVKQQLGTQALSIANQTPQSILSLFRN